MKKFTFGCLNTLEIPAQKSQRPPAPASVLDIISILLLILGLAGCSSTDENKLEQYIHSIKSRPARPVEPIPEFVAPEKFVYPEDILRRSPFKPLEVLKKEDPLAPNPDRKKGPLEAFPLDSLKFVGILKQNGTTWGLISQPSGLISRVRPGDYMGENYGQIVKITDSSIQLEETVRFGDKWEKRDIVLKLK